MQLGVVSEKRIIETRTIGWLLGAYDGKRHVAITYRPLISSELHDYYNESKMHV
jgi:hypothetical protein